MKIGGVYILSRRSIARMIATITAALMSLYAAVTAQAQNTVRRIHDAAIALHMLDRQMMGGVTRTVVPEIMYREYKALYLELRKDKSPPGGGAAAQSGSSARHYATRKSISVSQAAEITGLSESTIKRLDKDPKNTNYPGRNATAKILAAWARLYRDGKIAAREVRAANRPMLGHVRS